MGNQNQRTRSCHGGNLSIQVASFKNIQSLSSISIDGPSEVGGLHIPTDKSREIAALRPVFVCFYEAL